MNVFDRARRWQRRIESGENQSSIAKSESGKGRRCSEALVSMTLRCLKLPNRYEEMLGAGKIQEEAVMTLAKIPEHSDLQEAALAMAMSLRRVRDAISDYKEAQLEPQERKPSKVRRSPKGKVRASEAKDVLAFLDREDKEGVVGIKSW